MMQLDDFKKKVDKNVLKDARMTEEEYRQFLKAYEEMLRRRQQTGLSAEKPADPQATQTLPSFGGKAVTPSEGNSGEPGTEGRALPPPSYRDAYQKLTRELSRPAEKK
jgi:hypothetical protein